MLPIVLLVFLGIVAAFGTLGNLFLIGTVAVETSLHVRGNVFVVNLALADLVITTYVMPIALTSWSFGGDRFGKQMCDADAFLVLTSCGASIQSLMLVALERYFHICRHTHYDMAFSNRAVVVYVVLAWLYSAAWGAQGFTGWTSYVYGNNTHVCMFDGAASQSYNVISVLVVVLLPMIVIALCYGSIFSCAKKCRDSIAAHNLRQSESLSHSGVKSESLDQVTKHLLLQKQRRMKRELKLIFTLVSIVIAFVICWSPGILVALLFTFWPGLPTWFLTAATWLAFCNSSVNTVLYGVMNRNFRNGYLRLFNTIFCCGRRIKCALGGGQDKSPSDDSPTQEFKYLSSDAPLTSRYRTVVHVKPEVNATTLDKRQEVIRTGCKMQDCMLTTEPTEVVVSYIPHDEGLEAL